MTLSSFTCNHGGKGLLRHGLAGSVRAHVSQGRQQQGSLWQPAPLERVAARWLILVPVAAVILAPGRLAWNKERRPSRHHRC